MRFRFNFFSWIILAYAGVSIFFIFRLGLTEQEAYYWLWAKNLDWAYFDHPPLQAWITALFTSIFGDEKWVVRLPAFFGDLATLILFYNWVKLKWDQKTAELCVFLLLSSTVFMMGSVIALPDSLAIPLALTAMIYAVNGQPRRTGFFLGLALLAKWTVLLIIPGILYAFYRKSQLRFKEMLPLSLIALVLQAPVIWWNYEHRGVSWKFHLYGRHAHEWQSLSNYLENAGQFILAQIFSLGLVTSILIVIVFLSLRKDHFKSGSGVQWRAVMFWTLPGLSVFFISAIQGQLRFYWTFLSLLPLIGFVGYFSIIYFPRRYELIRAAAVATILLHWVCGAIAGFYPVGQTLEEAFKLKTDIRHSPMGEFSGWQQWYEQTVVPSGLLRDDTALIGSDLHVAARFGWTIRKNKKLSSVGVAGTNKNQFQIWPQPGPPEYKSAIFFGDNRYDRMSNFDGDCAHPVEWKTSSSKVLDRTIKDIYWGYCNQLSFR